MADLLPLRVVSLGAARMLRIQGWQDHSERSGKLLFHVAQPRNRHARERSERYFIGRQRHASATPVSYRKLTCHAIERAISSYKGLRVPDTPMWQREAHAAYLAKRIVT
jgi:hypothetical protein